jgi:uncharacterized lipoprotein YbaY
MRSVLVAAVLAVTAIVLAGCRDKKPEPVPGPQSSCAREASCVALVQNNTPAHRNKRRGICATAPG